MGGSPIISEVAWYDDGQVSAGRISIPNGLTALNGAVIVIRYMRIFNRKKAAPPTEQSIARANLRHNVAAILIDISGFGTSLGFIGFDTLLPILAFTLTGNKALVGLMGTVWIGMWLLPQMAAGRWMARRPHKKPVMVGAALVSRLAFALLVGLLALGRAISPTVMFAALVAAIATFRCFDAVAAVAWLDTLTKALPMRVRSQVFGLGQAFANILRFGASLVVAAAIAGGLKYPDSYLTLYGFAVIALSIGMLGLVAIREPVEENHASLSSQMGFVSHALHVLREDARFRQVTIARLLLGAFDLARPQYVVHATVELGLADSSIGLFITAQTVGGILASVALGRLSMRQGSAAVIRVTTTLAAIIPLLALGLHLLAHHQPGLATAGYLMLFALLGAIDASGLLGFLAYVLDIAPPGERPSYTGLANTLAGVVVFAPTLGGIILQITSYHVLFVCSLTGAALALLAALRLPSAEVAEA